jgi:3'-phosphoadenosine 5'-phosphosulfate sulfotransferase (PAPS reductase)/FAD synthetase
MDTFTKEGFLSVSKLPSYKARIEQAFKNIREIQKKYDILSVSVSGGKDSLVLLDMCLKLNPKIKVWHWDYGIFMPRPIENEVISILKTFFHLSEPQLTLSYRNSKNAESTTGYKAFFAENSNYTKINNIDMNLLGLRTQESCKRKRRCKNLIEEQNKCAFPIRDLTWEDVWAYIISNNISYPSPYDIRAPIIGWDKTRFVTFFDPEFQHLGSMDQDKFLFFNLQNKS